MRAFPEEFAKDRTTFEKLVRMEHYGYPTRLMNVTPKLMTALGMVRSEGYAPNAEDDEQNGYIHVYRVRESRIKYGTSDTVTALSNLARLKSERVTMDNLCYLAAECKNDRAGFFWEKGSKTSEELLRDIRKVWCVHPMANNIRSLGAEAVKSAPYAWLSFALDSETMIDALPCANDIRIGDFSSTATDGRFAVSVGIENVSVGTDATSENLKKVFALVGGHSLDDMSSDNVEITSCVSDDGKVKFTAGPKDAEAPTFFMRVKMTP